MLGTIIGAGVFALPAAMKAGGIFGASIAYWLIAGVVIGTHLLYAEVIVKGKGKERHRLPGQAGKYLGAWAERVTFISHPAQILGACLAYLVIGGGFLSSLAHQLGIMDSVLAWQILFWACGSALVLSGMGKLSRVGLAVTWAMVGLLTVAIILFLPHADPQTFFTLDIGGIPATLGVFIFALTGWTAVPEVADRSGNDRKKTRNAVIAGTVAAAFLMWLFGVLGYAAVGAGLTSDPENVAAVFPAFFFWLFPIIGAFTVMSPFVNLSHDMAVEFQIDGGIPRSLSVLMVLLPPLALLFLTSRNFSDTVGFVGAFLTAFNSLVVCVIALVARKKEKGLRPAFFPVLFGAVYLAILLQRLFL